MDLQMNPKVIIAALKTIWDNRDKYGKAKAWQNARRRKRMAKKGLDEYGRPLPTVPPEGGA